MKITYQECMIDDVFRYFVKGFKLGNQTLVKWEATHDQRSGIVIFKLVTKDKSKDLTS
jgi:hypothetical protein